MKTEQSASATSEASSYNESIAQQLSQGRRSRLGRLADDGCAEARAKRRLREARSATTFIKASLPESKAAWAAGRDCMMMLDLVAECVHGLLLHASLPVSKRTYIWGILDMYQKLLGA